MGGTEIASTDHRQSQAQGRSSLRGAPLHQLRSLLAGSISGMSDFPAYAPSQEHELLRQMVRELAAAEIAPRAAEVDERAEFPQHSLDALVANDLHAVHIPEAYGGVGAD